MSQQGEMGPASPALPGIGVLSSGDGLVRRYLLLRSCLVRLYTVCWCRYHRYGAEVHETIKKLEPYASVWPKENVFGNKTRRYTSMTGLWPTISVPFSVISGHPSLPPSGRRQHTSRHCITYHTSSPRRLQRPEKLHVRRISHLQSTPRWSALPLTPPDPSPPTRYRGTHPVQPGPLVVALYPQLAVLDGRGLLLHRRRKVLRLRAVAAAQTVRLVLLLTESLWTAGTPCQRRHRPSVLCSFLLRACGQPGHRESETAQTVRLVLLLTESLRTAGTPSQRRHNRQ